ncbi:Flp pilus assembly protein CpaB [Sphingomonas piscis]|uniref:Flp pilus assembly protein CpaB n=1 Tax=Sphingomonas piscis TaxID=2714943 RepID=A0A6G7YLU0_9SPHN|nr:Flp pilus assembly protein CpaB [Sphingomonas piscis]QIK77715.1 Flp pilus assembly protein CpaB [Sphingomonas piscis]
MDVKKVMLLVGALVIAAVTAIMAKNMFAGAGAEQAAAAPVPQGPKVLVAKRALPVGTIIDQESLAFQPWPQELVQSAYYLEGAPESDLTKLIGTVVRNPITAGQPVTRGALVGPEDRGFLAAALAPGMRAITVPVNVIGGVAGFVFPGDRVDLMLTQSINNGDGPALNVSETVVRNLRVLATDQRVDSKDEQGKTVVRTFSNVTLEVTPRIAEKVVVAQTVGNLSLSLRSIADNASELDRAVASGEVKVPQGANPAQEKKILKAAAGRPLDSNTTFSTGGDVSRFQRRTVPLRPEERQAQINRELAAAGKAVSAAAARSMGPTVRISRGNNVTVVPVGVR